MKTTSSLQQKSTVFLHADLVEIKAPAFDVELDLRYATEDNVTSKPLYGRGGCFLHKDAAQKLQRAILLAKGVGYRMKIFDAFRPVEAQQALWDSNPDPDFVSPPDTGSCPHCRGVAVDITLLDKNNTELDMGTAFDDFTPRSYHASQDISVQAQQNRFLLMGIMTAAGWDHYMHEWWHYQLFDPRTYPKLTDKEAGTQLI